MFLLLRIAAAGLSCVLAAIAADPAAGEAIFKSKGGCLRCHSVDNRGGSLGPDLSEIGVMRTPQSLRLAITDPDAEIYREYFTVVIETNDGKRLEGIALNEDDISIQLRDVNGAPRSFLKANLKHVGREQRSLMPSYATSLSSFEIDSLVAYLRTLRGASFGASRSPARGREIARVTENIDWLNRPERDADERPDTLLDALQIPPGASIADVGAGSGYFTWRLARKVGPAGKVFAVDVQQTMLDLVAKEVKKHNLANVEPVLGSERDPRLPEGALDLVFIANSYHEFSEPEAIMAAVRRSLKPNGRLVVIEYAKENSFVPVAPAHKMTIEDMRAEIEPVGFELDRILDFLPMQHGLVFTVRRN